MTKYPLLESVVIIYIIMLSDIAVVRNSAFFYFAPENDYFFFLFPPMLPILKGKIFSLLPHTLFTSLIFVLSDADVNLVLRSLI